ncbi:MAG: PGF-CTERM sorting domain-containing protein [Haloarculaceae archaeon]
MRRELVLAGLLVGVIVASAGIALAAPGVFTASQETQTNGTVSLTELTVSAGEVTGETVDLQLDARLSNHDGVSENVTVEFRAVGTDSGLVETRKTVSVGEISRPKETRVVANLTVDRGTDYRLETVVYRDGQRRGSRSKTVSGTGSLPPGYADVGVNFYRFTSPDLPVIEYAIEDVQDNQTTMAVWTHLTNTGVDPSESVRVVLKARQVDSNIVADQTEVQVDSIEPGRTTVPRATLSVPSSYNYYLDAVLYQDDVVVGTARSGASLDPTKTVDVNTTTQDVGLEVSDFERGDSGTDSGVDNGDAGERADVTAEGESGPGFGVAVTLVALVAGLLAVRRRSDQ